MPRLKQKKPIKAVIKRLIAGAALRAIYICFKVTDKINDNTIMVVTLDLRS